MALDFFFCIILSCGHTSLCVICLKAKLSRALWGRCDIVAFLFICVISK